MFSMLADLVELSRDSIFPNKPVYTEDNLPDLSGRVYVVTGATAGIGYETARLLLTAGARVWIIGRTQSKLDEAFESLGAIGDVRGLILRFEDPATIEGDLAPLLARESVIHGVVHNAGMNYRGHYMSHGYLDVIVVNVISPWVLQSHLNGLLVAAVPSMPAYGVRVVWVASAAHYFSPGCGGIDWDNINNEQINGRFGFGIYGQTKVMNIYEAKVWADKHAESGVLSVSVHPGTVESEIRRYRPDRNRNMAALCHPTVYGAYAEISPLLDPSLGASDNGQYFRPYGARGRVRPDVMQALHGPRADKFFEWVEHEARTMCAAPASGASVSSSGAPPAHAAPAPAPAPA